MFCSECGKTIADDALICPECGAVTKNGIMALKSQESSNQQTEVTEQSIALSDEKKSNNQMFVRILGLLGSAAILVSLLSDFASLTAPLVGTVTVSMANHLDKLIFLAIALACLSILASLLRYYLLQILSGFLTAAWAGYMIWKIQEAIPNTEYSELVSVEMGLGIYLFILAACLILASGFIGVVVTKKTKKSPT